jgi:hypothetical protein
MFIDWNLTNQAPFGGAELTSSGTGLDTLRSSERRRRDGGSRAINITFLRSKERPNKTCRLKPQHH